MIYQVIRRTPQGRWVYTDGKAHYWDTPPEYGTQAAAVCGFESSRRKERMHEDGDPQCGLCERWYLLRARRLA